MAAVEEQARQIHSNVDAHSVPDNVSWSGRAGDALIPSLRRHVARQIKEFRETEPAQRRFRGSVWWSVGGVGGDGAVVGGKVLVLGADGAGSGKADKERGRGCGKGKKAGNDVTPGRKTGSLQRRCGGCRAS